MTVGTIVLVTIFCVTPEDFAKVFNNEPATCMQVEPAMPAELKGLEYSIDEYDVWEIELPNGLKVYGLAKREGDV